MYLETTYSDNIVECTECGTIFDILMYNECPCCELRKENDSKYLEYQWNHNSIPEIPDSITITEIGKE